MKNFLRIWLTLFIVLPLTSSFIFCCCLEEAFAKTASIAEHCHGHPGKAAPSKSSHGSHECMCQKPFDAHVDESFDVTLIPNFLSKDFFKDAKKAVQYIQDSLVYCSLPIAYHSPPLLASADQPIYLRISTLRL